MSLLFHVFSGCAGYTVVAEGAFLNRLQNEMQTLGHKNIKNTLIYTQLVKLEKDDAFHSATAKTAEEAKNLVESGFEFVCTTPDCLMLFRKRK